MGGETQVAIVTGATVSLSYLDLIQLTDNGHYCSLASEPKSPNSSLTEVGKSPLSVDAEMSE